MRLVEVFYGGKEYRLTAYLAALYWQRWRIEDAYATVKCLLGLAYFWCGAQTGSQRGQAKDVVIYLAANAKLPGIVKRKRKSAHLSPLELILILTTSENP